ASLDRRPAGRAYLFVPPPRPDRERTEAGARRGILARPGAPRRGSVPGGAGGGVVPDRTPPPVFAGRPAGGGAGRAGRSFGAVFGGSAGVVLSVPVSISKRLS